MTTTNIDPDLTPEVAALVMRLSSPLLPPTAAQRVWGDPHPGLSSGEAATLAIARLIATGRADDPLIGELLPRLDATLAALVRAAMPHVASIHVCAHCGFEIVNEDPHTNCAGEDVHALCCEMCA